MSKPRKKRAWKHSQLMARAHNALNSAYLVNSLDGHTIRNLITDLAVAILRAERCRKMPKETEIIAAINGELRKAMGEVRGGWDDFAVDIARAISKVTKRSGLNK